MEIIYDKVKMPETGVYVPVDLTQETMAQRRERVYNAMEQRQLDILLIYGDREHGGNFAYLTGFEPRFEEAVLVLQRDRQACLLLGNENLKMAAHSMIDARCVHVPYFSLPNQPMENVTDLEGLFREAGICDGRKIGIAGWKLFSSPYEDNGHLFDVPYFIVETVKNMNPHGSTVNAAELFINPRDGVRTRCSANELAHYEFGAGLASSKVLEALNAVCPGQTEMQIASILNTCGQPVSVTTICATGERFTGAVVFPRNKEIKTGDTFALTLGLRGGLSSRSAYVVKNQEELPEHVSDYMDKVAKPYYRAAVTWYEKVGIGVTGGELYQAVESALPKSIYKWSLNPGHYTSDEEWLSSPVWKDSDIPLSSGMLMQMDIIPRIPGYGGASAEDGIVLADEELRAMISQEYPAVWARMQKRREYMKNELEIHLGPEVLPLSDICGYMRPYILEHDRGLRVKA